MTILTTSVSTMNHRFSVICLGSILLTVAASAAEHEPAKPLEAGMSPQAAAAQMTLPEGFRVQLAAGEPRIHQPIAFAIDHRGRLWVAEAFTYPRRAPAGKGRDKIVILEDTDGDGSLDKRMLFAKDLNLVSGLEVGFGGVWVGAAPYLLFIPDKNGDDRPDGDPQVLLDGFGYQDTHETLNSFIWGPDGWLYGCHGVFTHSRVGRPGAANEQRTPLNAGVWRYHPTRHQFEVFAHGSSNPWGVDFDQHGQAFITACVIPHLFHVIQGARYQRQGGVHFNPHTYDDLKTIADHAHYAGNIRDHAWWGHEPDVPQDTAVAGGGHAHCGAMIYLGDNWPDAYRDKIYMNNIHGNRVNCDVLRRQGSGFVGQHDKDLLLANDRWFRGINLKYGPDGSVYLIDWYDKNACHRTDSGIWDRTNGRIYRIRYGDAKPNRIDLANISGGERIDLVMHRNHWYSRTASRMLQEDGGTDAQRAVLSKIIEYNDSLSAKLRALWALHVIDGIADGYSLTLLDSPHEYIRAWAIQLQLEDHQAADAFLHKLATMAKQDPSAVVRLYLAAALQRLPLEQRWPIVEGLIQHAEDASDHNLPLMYWYAIEPMVAADSRRALQLSNDARISTVQRFIIRRVASANQSLPELIAALADAEDEAWQSLVLHEILHAMEGRVEIPMPKVWSSAYERLTESPNREIRELADQLAVLFGDHRIFPGMRALLADSKATLPQRRKAMGILIRGRDPAAATALQSAVATAELRGEAIRALAYYPNAKTPEILVAAYAEFSELERRDAIATLVSRPSYALALLDAIKQERIPRTDVHAYHIRQLAAHNNEPLNERIREVWGEIRATSKDKQERILRYKNGLTAARIKAADASNGRRLFAKNCATCHTLFGEGEKIGPDITGSNRANLDYILENLLDPSAVLGKDYQMTVVATSGGQIVSGLVQKETDSALTIRTINDTIVVPKSEIEDQRLSATSLMPDGLLEQLTEQEVADLVKYLGSPSQVALRGPPAPIDARTGRVPAAIEGESMETISQTAGQTRRQNMAGFTADRWSGAEHLWWTGGRPGAELKLALPVKADGLYHVEIVMTKARDYGVVQLSLDDTKLGGPIDLYNSPDVITTGVIQFQAMEFEAGKHELGIEILGAHPQAAKAYMFGLDYVRLVPVPR